MSRVVSRLLVSVGLLTATVAALAAAPPSVLGRRGLVASDHRLASEAGRQILADGGNAVDAAIATALVSGVVQPSGSGLGGGGFSITVTPDGKASALDFREVAPAAATRDMFVEAGRDDASQIGGLAVAVPGEARGLTTLHSRQGRLPWHKVVAPAIQVAGRGFFVEHHLAKSLAALGVAADELGRGLFDGWRAPDEGEWVTRRNLQKTLVALSRGGAAALYEGAGAAAISAAAKESGGILTVEDLAQYTVKDRTPIVGTYRGWTVTTMPPPSSGGVVLLQLLQVLEGYDLPAMGLNSAEYVHLVSEASKHAYADRAHYMGDPDRVEVPVAKLLAPERIDAIRHAIYPMRTFPPDAYGTPVDAGKDAGTLHLSVLDAEGMAVALTTTINTGFGSRVVVPTMGLVLNNEMDDFVARPGVPNAFGLVGSEANAVAPGARPLSSMTPTVLVSPDGTQRIVVGASGGPFIISSTLQVVLNIVDFGLDPSAAVGAPRFHHQWQPDTLFLDEGFSADTVRLLQARGHTTKEMPFFSAVQVVHQTEPGTMRGASDPRKGGWPAGVL